jgi:hypothetical protein
MKLVDWSIVVLYCLAMAGVGVYFTQRASRKRTARMVEDRQCPQRPARVASAGVTLGSESAREMLGWLSVRPANTER